jgi:transposase
MLQLSPQSVIFLATKHVDFRKGLDGLIAVCRQLLAIEPLEGPLFLFYNRTKTTIKILAYDGQGFILFIKRLSKGTFKPDLKINDQFPYLQICHRTLQILINNGKPIKANCSKNWRNLRSN